MSALLASMKKELGDEPNSELQACIAATGSMITREATTAVNELHMECVGVTRAHVKIRERNLASKLEQMRRATSLKIENKSTELQVPCAAVPTKCVPMR